MAEINWRDHMPRSVLDPFCPQGHVITESVERRMLWHLEGVLTVRATSDALRSIARNLRDYLDETCVHHWHTYEPDPGNDNDIAAHRQCLWCNDVEWRHGQPDLKEETK